MREVYIKYNPYRLETVITIDGSVPKPNSHLIVSDRRLQEWIEDLPKILFDEYSCRNFRLQFHGTTLDYEDVEAMVNEAKREGFSFELEHIPAKEVADKESAIDEIFEEIQSGPFDELKQPDVIKAFNMAKSKDFEVNVIATMSAGKSTLINALLRKKLMPAKQEACTAMITEIKDNDKNIFTARAYNKYGIKIYDYPQITLNDMNSLNNDPEVSKVRIDGNIPFVSSEDVSLVLVDTPGPNNSRDQEHKTATYRALSESSKTLVLYILNATQLAVNDDYNLLEDVASSMKVGGKQSRDRFIFVVNKLDDFKKDEDSVKSALDKVNNYLKDNGIDNANIYPASALTALNIRTILADSDDDDDDDIYEAKGKVRKFNRNPEMHFENYAPLAPSSRKNITRQLEEARRNGDVNEEALIHCGIIPIETAIQMYVEKYAKTAKIKNIVDTFSKRLESAKCLEKIKIEITENKNKQQEILYNIEKIKEKLKSGKNVQLFKKRISKLNYDKEIEKLANSVIFEAQKKITNQLSSADEKISKREAEELCRQFARFIDNLQADIQVKLEKLISDHVFENAKGLLEEYKNRISGLAEDIDAGDIPLDPLKLMEGDLSIDISSLIDETTKTENVKTGEQIWVKNTRKKWYKPWTWLEEKGHWEDEYEDKEYVDGIKLSQRFFAPVQERMYENSNNAVKYAKEQAKIIKQEFSKKFEELDDVLNKKLKELEDCAKDNENVERKILESQSRLEWLENIKNNIEAILDI